MKQAAKESEVEDVVLGNVGSIHENGADGKKDSNIEIDAIEMGVSEKRKDEMEMNNHDNNLTIKNHGTVE